MQNRQVDKLYYKLNDNDSDLPGYFVQLNGTIPSVYSINGPFIMNELEDIFLKTYKNDAVMGHTWEDENSKEVTWIISADNSSIFVKNNASYPMHEFDLYNLPKEKIKKYKNRIEITSEISIYYDIKKGIPSELISQILKIRIKKNKDLNKIHLICQDQDIGLYTKELPITGTDYEFDLDLHYGEGFSKFHELNLKRIQDKNKGIILLYGPPGTGKSFYVNRLTKDLITRDKKVLYLPNNMVDNLGTPSFNNFLIEWAEDNKNERDGKKAGILMIIEDAERVLLKRDTNPYGADGVSNILNSTDGILNKFLNIQVLATFNTDLNQIDEAILRKKRALSIKELGKLNVKDSQRLIDFLKVDYKATEDMSLADIYALVEEEEDKILFEDVKKKSDIIGFGGSR